jgi:hypothetical protein
MSELAYKIKQKRGAQQGKSETVDLGHSSRQPPKRGNLSTKKHKIT